MTHLGINDQYVQKYFQVSFLDPFLANICRLFGLVRKNPGVLLAQEEIHNKLKFKRKDKTRKRAILSSVTHIPENNRWGEGFFKMAANEFGIEVDFLNLYQQLISANSGLACHRNLPLKVRR